MSVSQLCRVDAELLLETSREVTRNGKAHLGRHLTDGPVGLLQEPRPHSYTDTAQS